MAIRDKSRPRRSPSLPHTRTRSTSGLKAYRRGHQLLTGTFGDPTTGTATLVYDLSTRGIDPTNDTDALHIGFATTRDLDTMDCDVGRSRRSRGRLPPRSRLGASKSDVRLRPSTRAACILGFGENGCEVVLAVVVAQDGSGEDGRVGGIERSEGEPQRDFVMRRSDPIDASLVERSWVRISTCCREVALHA